MAGYNVGYDELVGGDDDFDGMVAGLDIVGDAAPAQGASRKVNAKSLPQSFVGIPLTDVPASSTGVNIQVNVQRVIRPDRFVLDRVQAASLLVYDIKVGTISLNASTQPIPGDAFAPDAIDTAIRAVTKAIPAVGIQLILGNRTATQVDKATGAFFGPSLPG
jgi:hypothetical protein